jgi:RNA polymerase sigma-70 factor (ECF subfamily)
MTLPPFWSLIDAHGAELFAYARRLVGGDAEDVLQEALLRALRSYPRLRNADHLRAWLFRVVTTTAFDHGSDRTRRREVVTNDVPDRAERFDDDGDGFEELIGDLPDGTRTALALRFVDDLPYETIARRLGCSTVAARQRVSTGVRQLRKRLT